MADAIAALLNALGQVGGNAADVLQKIIEVMSGVG